MNDQDNNNPGMMTTLKQKVELVVRMCADPRLTDADVSVAAVEVLAFFNTKTGQCNPSGELIAKPSTKCRDTVIEANKRLARFGYSEVKQSSGARNKRNAYRFNWSAEGAPCDQETIDTADSLETETVGTKVST